MRNRPSRPPAMPTVFNDAPHWKERAEEARVLAEQMTDPEAKRTMLEVAASYDKLAKRALERLAGKAPAD